MSREFQAEKNQFLPFMVWECAIEDADAVNHRTELETNHNVDSFAAALTVSVMNAVDSSMNTENCA